MPLIPPYAISSSKIIHIHLEGTMSTETPAKKFYVLKDKKYGSYVGSSGYVSFREDAKTFTSSYEAKKALTDGVVKANASFFTGGLQLVEVTQEPGKPTYRLLSQGDVGKFDDTIKYVVRSGESYLTLPPGSKTELSYWSHTLDDATKYASAEDAIYHLMKRAIQMSCAYSATTVRTVAVSNSAPVLVEKVIENA
jgi:hypothetical protein